MQMRPVPVQTRHINNLFSLMKGYNLRSQTNFVWFDGIESTATYLHLDATVNFKENLLYVLHNSKPIIHQSQLTAK